MFFGTHFFIFLGHIFLFFWDTFFLFFGTLFLFLPNQFGRVLYTISPTDYPANTTLTENFY